MLQAREMKKNMATRRNQSDLEMCEVSSFDFLVSIISIILFTGYSSVTAKNSRHLLWPPEQNRDQNSLTQKFKFCKDLSIKSVGMEGFLRANCEECMETFSRW